MRVSKNTIGPTIQKYGLEYLGRYYAIYRGIVLNNQDPDDKCRLLVRVPSLFGDRWYPIWAVPVGIRGTYQAGSKPLIPKEGEVVWVSFINGDPRFPVWDYHGWAVGEMPNELKGQDVAGTVTPCGNSIVLDDKNSNLDATLVDPTDKTKFVKVSITQGKNVKIEAVNGEVDIQALSINQYTDKANLQPAVLGDTLVELVSQLLTTLKEGKVLTQMGPQSFMPDTQARLDHLSNELNKILSDTVKIE